jgi:GNAT superfamily N-acetyltransferase
MKVEHTVHTVHTLHATRDTNTHHISPRILPLYVHASLPSLPPVLERIYVEQSAIGRGVGASLMRQAIAVAVNEGYHTLWLGVWEDNPNKKSADFYRGSHSSLPPTTSRIPLYHLLTTPLIPSLIPILYTKTSGS